MKILSVSNLKKSVRAAELNDKIHFHSLRHSFASNLVQKGVSLYVVKELLGHEDIKTTQIYSHFSKKIYISCKFIIVLIFYLYFLCCE